MSAPENPPAFPSVEDHPAYDMPMHHFGMSLRDWFAGQVLYGLHGVPVDQAERESVASRCYAMADAMLAERAKASS